MNSLKHLVAAGVLPLLLTPAMAMAERDTNPAGAQAPRGEAHGHAEAHEQGAAPRGEARGHAAAHGDAMLTGDAAFLTQQEEGQIAADDLLGQPLRDQQGNEIGKISDLLIDRDGRIAGLIVSVEGQAMADDRTARTEQRQESERDMTFGTEGEREVALSWDVIELTTENGETVATASIERQTLEQASEFEARDEHRVGVERTTGMQREREAGAAGTAGTARQPGTQDRDHDQTAEYDRERQDPTAAREHDETRTMQRERVTGMQAFIQRQEHDDFVADNLIGSSVRDINDEEVGQISDLLLDREGKIKGVVIGVGGFLGIGERDVALSWDAIQLTTNEDGDPVARVDLDEEMLENAPEFEPRDDGGLW
jgi:sporulation protein YlmC with PRC-barrel domain